MSSLSSGLTVHPRGFLLNICMQVQPSSCARSIDLAKPPAMETWKPSFILPFDEPVEFIFSDNFNTQLFCLLQLAPGFLARKNIACLFRNRPGCVSAHAFDQILQLFPRTRKSADRKSVV